MRRENPDKPFEWERKPTHEVQKVTAAAREEPSLTMPREVKRLPDELPPEPPESEPIL